MRVFFKDTCQMIDTEKEILRISTGHGTYYVDNEQDYWETIRVIESLGKEFWTEVVDRECQNESL